ncbi:glycosyltransferase [Cohnella endophytica]|nr:glycosyltransferase [Cohnella endophytica]
MDKLLSLCMIVKNEERVLSRCLDSVRDFVDEIIIIDTGSTDRTKEIAAQYTNHIFDFEWVKDFAAARNEAIRRATSKWILVLDADEYIERSDGVALRPFLSSLNTRKKFALSVPVLSLTGESGNVLEAEVARIFPANKGIYFHRPIHEQLTCDSGKLPLYKYDLRIYHSGYTPEVLQEKNKSKRNLEIFEKLKESGKMKQYDYYTLGNEYKVIKEYQKAIECYEKAFSNLNPELSYYKRCLIGLIDCYIALNMLQEAYNHIEKHLSRWSRYPEYHTIKALVLNELGFYDKGRIESEKAIRIAENGSNGDEEYWLISPDYGGVFPYQNLVEYYYRKQDIHQSVFYLSKILNERPNHFYTLYRLVTLLSQSESTQSIVSLMNKLYPKQTNQDLFLLLCASLKLADHGLSEHYLSAMVSAGHDIGTHSHLRYAILKRDRSLFDQYRVNSPDIVHVDHVMPELLAALLWNDTEYLPANTEVQAVQFLHSFINTSIQGDKSIITPSAAQEILLYDLLVELYRYQIYEVYDILMKRISSANLINMLANYYYDHHHLELATDYYSILLQEGKLNAQGYENLAHFHFNQGEAEEGIGFLQAAIELESGKVQYYSTLSAKCTDEGTTETYWKQGFEYFPQYRQLISRITSE